MPAVLPSLSRIAQLFPAPRLKDPVAAAQEAARALLAGAAVGPGRTVGITLGSRGIAGIVEIVRAVVRAVEERGARAVGLAAMGSHGGGSGEGQLALLRSLGLTGESLGMEVVACASCREIGRTSSGTPVRLLDSAFDVDFLLPVNRVKPHTSFKGRIESGLLKKLVVGLGGPDGATQFHSLGKSALLSPFLEELGGVILERMPVVGGIALVENAREETALVEAVVPGDLLRREAELLEYARSLMPRLPAERLDVLIVEEMGKNYSGTGMDTGIIGRMRIQGEPDPGPPEVGYLAVLDLSEESHGNANGIGLADFTTTALVNKIDRAVTYRNSLTATFPQRASIPLYLDTEQRVLETMFRLLAGRVGPGEIRLAVIANTLHLGACLVSVALARELEGRQDIRIEGSAAPLRFDAAGRMLPRLGRYWA